MAAPIGKKPKGGNGRPIYSEEFNNQAYKLALLGMIDDELAVFFNVSQRTINNWKKKYPDFDSALKRGKAVADSNVATKLYARSVGYEFEEKTIETDVNSKAVRHRTVVKHIPPDTTAQIFWLKNRRPELWRDRRELTGKDGADLIKPAEIDVTQYSPEEKEVLRKLGDNFLNDKNR